MAVNFFDRGFKELTLPLEYGQRAPIGYLWVVKFITLVSGYSEFSLRFLSLLAGCSSLFLFYLFLNKHFSKPITTFALFLLAVSEPLIYFSSELKQYMLELSVTLIALLTCIPQETDRPVQYVYRALLGSLLIWFSFPIIFVLVSIAIVGLLFAKRSLRSFLPQLWVYFAWAVSFFCNYFLFVRSGTEDRFLLNFWKAHFMPLSLAIFRWTARLIYQTLNTPLGLNLSILAAVALFIGIYQLWRQDKKSSMLFILPLIIALAASALHKYPFHGRFLVFITPVLLVWIAIGITYLYQRAATLRNYKLIQYSLLIFLFAPPLLTAIYQVIYPRTFYNITRQEIRPVIQKILENRQDGDVLFVNKLALAQFKYYDRVLGVTKAFNLFAPLNKDYEAQGNQKDPQAVQIVYSNNINLYTRNYLNKRGWFLFSRDKYDEEAKSIEFLSSHFKLKMKYKSIRASAYLYSR